MEKWEGEGKEKGKEEVGQFVLLRGCCLSFFLEEDCHIRTIYKMEARKRDGGAGALGVWVGVLVLHL